MLCTLGDGQARMENFTVKCWVLKGQHPVLSDHYRSVYYILYYLVQFKIFTNNLSVDKYTKGKTQSFSNHSYDLISDS